jgi:lipoic acid synthetase
MILGSNCTRNCGFCSVKTSHPESVDEKEAENVAIASEEMGLKYIVVTSVTRDDLPYGGAGHFARTVDAIRKRMPYTRIEVLTPDFSGNINALRTVLSARPDVYNHNVETVERLYPVVRPGADYRRSLSMLRHASEFAPEVYTKSGFMLGLGERDIEVIRLLEDLRSTECDFVTIGQYLRPSRNNLPVVEYIKPDIFEDLRIKALEMGFKYVASGPLVRSSMNAEEIYEQV